MTKKLTRSRDHRVIAGVCGGIAEYFNIDVTVVRIITAVVSAFWGVGVVAYIVAWLLLPEEGTGHLGADALFEKYSEYRAKVVQPPTDQPRDTFDPSRQN